MSKLNSHIVVVRNSGGAAILTIPAAIVSLLSLEKGNTMLVSVDTENNSITYKLANSSEELREAMKAKFEVNK